MTADEIQRLTAILDYVGGLLFVVPWFFDYVARRAVMFRKTLPTTGAFGRAADDLIKRREAKLNQPTVPMFLLMLLGFTLLSASLIVKLTA